MLLGAKLHCLSWIHRRRNGLVKKWILFRKFDAVKIYVPLLMLAKELVCSSLDFTNHGAVQSSSAQQIIGFTVLRLLYSITVAVKSLRQHHGGLLRRCGPLVWINCSAASKVDVTVVEFVLRPSASYDQPITRLLT